MYSIEFKYIGKDESVEREFNIDSVLEGGDISFDTLEEMDKIVNYIKSQSSNKVMVNGTVFHVSRYIVSIKGGKISGCFLVITDEENKEIKKITANVMYKRGGLHSSYM